MTCALRNGRISKDGKKLVIDVKPSGAQRADLDIPETFKGTLRISTVSGTVDVGEKMTLSEMKLETASGDITIDSWPLSKLEINTVSGEVRSAEDIADPAPKTIVLQSVSGDFDVKIQSSFETLKPIPFRGAYGSGFPRLLTMLTTCTLFREISMDCLRAGLSTKASETKR